LILGGSLNKRNEIALWSPTIKHNILLMTNQFDYTKRAYCCISELLLLTIAKP